MNRNLGIVAGCVLIFAVIYFAWGWLGQEQPQTPQQLTQQAIEAKDPVQCEKAVAKLAQLPRTGYKAAKHFREVLKKSDLPTVRATAIQGLSSEGDYDSMSLIIAALDDPDPLVRGRACAAVESMLGVRFDMRHDDSVEKRKVKIKLVKDAWQEMQNSPMMKDWERRRKKVKSRRN